MRRTSGRSMDDRKWQRGREDNRAVPVEPDAATITPRPLRKTPGQIFDVSRLFLLRGGRPSPREDDGL